MNSKALTLISMLLYAAVATADPIHFQFGKNGDPTKSGTDTYWQVTANDHYQKMDSPLLSSFAVNIDSEELVINISSQSEGAQRLMLASGGGIGIDGNSKGDINGEEILALSFNRDVYLNQLFIKSMNTASIVNYKVGSSAWLPIDGEVSPIIGTMLVASDLIQLTLNEPVNNEQFRLEGLDVSLNEMQTHAPSGNYIRLRPLQNQGFTALSGTKWNLDDKTANDIFNIIEDTQPAELERFISGPFEATDLVPVDDGQPEMTIVEFLDEVMERCDCIITPRVTLDYYQAQNSWSIDYPDNTLWAVLDNLYNLPLKKPLRKVSLDNWGTFSGSYEEEEIEAVLLGVKDMGWEIATNYIGGNYNSYDIITGGAFGVNHSDFLPNLSAFKAIAFNKSIKDLILYLDFKNPAEELSQLPPDEQANKLIAMSDLQATYGYTFVWPVHNANWWSLDSTFTSVDGPYGGKSLYDVMLDNLVATKTRKPTPENGAVHVGAGQVLSWRSGLQSKWDKVYFGQDINDLELICTTTDNTCVPHSIEKNATYYWQVDIVIDGGVITGDVWTFDAENQQVVYPSQDTVVKENYPNVNYGTNLNFSVGKFSPERHYGLIEFKLGDYEGEISSVKLKVFVEDLDDKPVNLSTASVADWDENTVTWASKPAIATPIAQAVTKANQWLEFDVTAHVYGGSTISFYLTSDVGFNYINFSSKESANAPYLKVL